MSEHTATIAWERRGARFTDSRYDRRHLWRFDGGVEVPASASPHIVPAPLSSAEAIDPEEAFVAALASCHMLWFLSIAARAGVVVESYVDEPIGELSQDADGNLAMTVLRLRPRVAFEPGTQPAPSRHIAMHDEAHERCFLARSVRTEILCTPIDVTG
jgi:organic hydroperoxide reductase OsmC/OhrA